MKKTSTLVVLSLLSLSLTACGKKSSHIKFKLKVNTVKQQRELQRAIECGVKSAASLIPTSLGADYDVKLYSETIDKVLHDLKSQSDLDPNKFWASLSPEVRNTLNYELNFHVVKNPIGDSQMLYQSTAHFFVKARENYTGGTTYKLKDQSGQVFAFKVRGAATGGDEFLGFKCGVFNPTDTTKYEVGPEVLRVEEVSNVYECRTDTKLMVLMEMKDSSFLKAGENTFKLATKDIVKKNKFFRLNLSYKAADVAFNVNVKKKNNEDVKDWDGKRSIIKLESAEYSIDEDGACENLKNPGFKAGH